MQVDFIIPLYYCDTSLYLPIEMCFSTLHATYPWFNLIVVDDASPLELPNHWPVTDTSITNNGYVATVNTALKQSTGDLIIIGNDDLQFFQGCLDRFFDLPDNMIASPADTASGSSDSFGAIWGMTRKTFETMGLLDERFKNFYADQEYYDRARKLGVEIIKWQDIVIPHLESATFKTLGNKDELLEVDRQIFNS